MEEFPRSDDFSGEESAIPFANPSASWEKTPTNEVSVGDLLAHHWQAVFDYASICTISPQSAKKLAGGAFLRTFGDLSPGSTARGSSSPWRVRLLSAVVLTTKEWSGDERGLALQPDLRARHRGEPGARPRPAHANLVLRAFNALPPRAQARLWHTEVEAEDIATSAALGSLNPQAARVELQRDRVLLRTACQQAHLNLGTDHCRRFNRLLDIHAGRPGVPIMADLQEHLETCGFCRRAADQLDHSGDRLPLLLAEAVLGFGATAYLASRTSRPIVPGPPAVPTPVPQRPGRHRRFVPLLRRALRRLRLPPVLAVVVVGNVVIAAAVTAFLALSPDSPLKADPAPARPEPGPGSVPPTRFRNVATGLCLDTRTPAEAGATAITTPCATQSTQLWRFDSNGLLRNEGTEDLCLAFHLASFRLQLASCTARTGDVPASAFDLLPDGRLVPRPDPTLAITPVDLGADTAVILKPADPGAPKAIQRWTASTLTQ